MLDELKNFLLTRKKTNLAVAAINLVIFLVMSFMGNPENPAFMLRCGACYTPAILNGEYWRLFTAMFLHFSLQHLLYNMICLIALGDILEEIVGPWKYLLIYLGGGLCGNLLSLALEMREGGGTYAVSAGASGAIFAVIGAVLWIVLMHRKDGRSGAVSAKRMSLVVVLMIIQGFMDTGVDNAAHIGGLAAGFLMGILLYRKSVDPYKGDLLRRRR